MSWLYEKRVYMSERNGAITLLRLFGVWQVRVGEYQQTGLATERMWRDAFKRVAPCFGSRQALRVLILGFGGGGMVRDLYRLFPSCSITAIEYDPAMVTIADKLSWWLPHARPTVLVGDAKALLPSLGAFDLIIVDIFHDNKPSSLLKDDDFLQSLKERLAPGGVVLANVSVSSEHLDAFQNILPRAERWVMGSNHLGSFGLSV